VCTTQDDRLTVRQKSLTKHLSEGGHDTLHEGREVMKQRVYENLASAIFPLCSSLLPPRIQLSVTVRKLCMRLRCSAAKVKRHPEQQGGQSSLGLEVSRRYPAAVKNRDGSKDKHSHGSKSIAITFALNSNFEYLHPIYQP
jgi:hypothetical protein